jgi:hypothetical protein
MPEAPYGELWRRNQLPLPNRDPGDGVKYAGMALAGMV